MLENPKPDATSNHYEADSLSNPIATPPLAYALIFHSPTTAGAILVFACIPVPKTAFPSRVPTANTATLTAPKGNCEPTALCAATLVFGRDAGAVGGAVDNGAASLVEADVDAVEEGGAAVMPILAEDVDAGAADRRLDDGLDGREGVRAVV